MLVTMGACATKQAGNANDSGRPANTATASANPQDDLITATKAQFDAKSFRARMVMSLSDGRTSSRLGEFVAPNRFHMVTDHDEAIVVGDATYRREPGKPWQRLPIDVGQIVADFRNSSAIDELRKADVKFVGAEVLDGVSTLVYQFTTTNTLGMNVTSVCKTWVGAADHLPRKIEVEADFNSTKAKTTNTYYDYDADIRIEPPK
jgi:hypothetical protein